MNSNETVVEYARSIGVEAQPDVVIELTEQGPQGTHGEKGDTGTVTPEMLDILAQTKSSANDAAKSSTNAAEKVDQASNIYEQVVKTKQEVQDLKDAAAKDAAEASQSLTDLVSNSEKNIKDDANSVLVKIQEGKNEIDAGIKDVKEAEDNARSSAEAAKSSMNAAQASAKDAQASAVKTATDADSVISAYNKIVKIEEDLNALSEKTEAAAKNIEASDKSVSDNYSAVKVLKDDIDKAKSIIDDQSLKVSDALNEAQKIASDVSNNAASAAASSAAAEEAKTAAEKASTLANNAATIVSGSLSDVQTLADKVAALKPAIDEANDEILTNKTVIEKLCTDVKDSADKASAVKTDVDSTATQITSDKAAIEGIQSSINNVSKDITDKLDQVNKAKDDISEDAKAVKTAKDSVENKWNEFSTIYYGASSTPPTGEIKIGALWLDTSGSPQVLKQYLSTGWSEIAAKTDFFTKSEINERFSNITANDVKETDDHKILTTDERNKITKLDENYVSKSGGTITGSLAITEKLNIGTAVHSSDGDIVGSRWSNGSISSYIAKVLDNQRSDLLSVMEFHLDNTVQQIRCSAIVDTNLGAGIAGQFLGPNYIVTDLYYNSDKSLHIKAAALQFCCGKTWYPLVS